MLRVMQGRAPALIHRVRPDNWPHIAQLFTSAVLQAAVTGEAVLDEELQRLARPDPSKLLRLSQRMQAWRSSSCCSVQGQKHV